MMSVEPEDLLAFSKGFFQRFGDGAAESARHHAEELLKAEDQEGFDVWMAVASCIDTLASGRSNSGSGLSSFDNRTPPLSLVR